MNNKIDQSNFLKLISLTETDFSTIKWIDFRDKIKIYPLLVEDNQIRMAFLKHEPGAKLPKHLHSGTEILYYLSGEQTDENGTHQKGDIVVNKKGSIHSATSTGCIILAFWEKPVTFINE